MQELETITPYRIEIPDFAVVLLIGVSGSGKSTFAAKHFLPTEVLSSDAFRALVSDDENDQAATQDAFEALHDIASIRLRRRKSVVIDATNVQPESRKPLLQLARQHDCLAVAIVLDVPERVCQTRNRARADRQFGPRVIAVQQRQMRQSLKNLRKEGFRYVFTLNEAQIAHAEVVRLPLWTDRRAEHGPFDLVGDVHGCYDELVALLGALGYAPEEATGAWRHPEGRRVVFVGDLVDRGPKVVETVRLAWAMAGTAFWVPGNHDNKLMRALKGNPVNVTHGLAESLRQIEAMPPEEREAFKEKYIPFVDALVSHLWLDEGRLCVAHAGMKEEYIGRASSRVREFALYGDTTGETDEFGLPVRYPWAQDYRGATTVVYGHTPVPDAEWLNNTINIDTGCVFGGKLTALRWPEREIVQVPAHATYAEPARSITPAETAAIEDPDLDALRTLARDAAAFPTLTQMQANKKELYTQIGQMEQKEIQAKAERILADMERRWADAFERVRVLQSEIKAGQEPQPAAPVANMPSLQWQHDELLRAEDVLGKRFITTRLMHNVAVPAENAAAALEVMSRFAVEPRWLIYLPPTMSPCETAPEGDALERPAEAFAYYRQQGVGQVVCQRKHMGSRAVVVICRDADAARRRFGATAENGLPGQCYTRTGRQFFDDSTLQAALLEEVSATLTRAGFWEEFATDWFCLDCELMPWNAKAQELLREQYAPVGAAAQAALSRSIEVVEAAITHGVDMTAALESLRRRQEDVARYTVAYSHYCWDVSGLADLRLAPFHLLAAEGRTYFDRDHAWHVATLARLAEHSPLFLATEMQAVNTLDDASQVEGAAWWQALTEAGGEGMVVKPREFIVRGSKGLAQPAVKVRGREYLRIIYGPEYTEPANLERLRQRSLHAKRRLALREFALGMEGLERFVRKEPLRRIHECVFGVLALESEPVDPRL
ncbi:MAG TPA: polynucleotide kinase-phosphatase [Chthonomonadaceae bacterium]|nr:polynucleotide kinase-phosphatase [Chthonomonadaceae bacterium]